MSVLRLPNAQSDLQNIVKNLTLIASVYSTLDDEFGLDEMRDVLANDYQISSQGATGALAIERSTRPDRSRDPLYNQVKMMSEIFRMLGWIRSSKGNRLKFQMTLLGLTVAIDSQHYPSSVRNGLVQESILTIVFPNMSTTNVGIANQRPFVWLLSLMHHLDGFITRDEIIIGLLGVTNDLPPGAFKKVIKDISESRLDDSGSDRVEVLATANDLQVNTLQNYTRFPIGVLTSPLLNWADIESGKIEFNGAKKRVYRLTDKGAALAASLVDRPDLRISKVESLPNKDRVNVAEYAFQSLLIEAGFPIDIVNPNFEHLRIEGQNALRKLGFSIAGTPIYNPELQENDEILAQLLGEQD